MSKSKPRKQPDWFAELASESRSIAANFGGDEPPLPDPEVLRRYYRRELSEADQVTIDHFVTVFPSWRAAIATIAREQLAGVPQED